MDAFHRTVFLCLDGLSRRDIVDLRACVRQSRGGTQIRNRVLQGGCTLAYWSIRQFYLFDSPKE